MGDRFLCLIKTHCFSFSSPHIPSSTSGPFLRPRPPLRFPKQKPTTTLPPHSSQFQLISTAECSDGSVLFRFGDEAEKAAFDELNSRLEEDLVAEGNVEGSEAGASPASSPEENAVLDFVTADEIESSAVLGDSFPSTNLQDAFTARESHDSDVSSAPRKLELHTVEGSEEYMSTTSEDELIEDEAHRRDVTGTSTPMPVGMHPSEGSEGYASTQSDDDLTESKDNGTYVVGASTPLPVELLTSEGSEGYPSTNSEDDLTESKEDGTDVIGASAPLPMELHTSEGSEGYSSSEDDLTESEGDVTNVVGASAPLPVELHTSEGSEGYSSSEDGLTESEGDVTDVVGASAPLPVELHTSEGSEVYFSTMSKDELTEGKEDRIDVVGASTPMPLELLTAEGSEGYPSAKSEEDVIESKEHETDTTGASSPMPAELHTFEGSEMYSTTKLEEELTDGQKDRMDVTEASTPRMVELVTVEGSESYPSTKSEDKFTEGKSHPRDVTGGSTDRKEDMYTVEGAEENAPINSEGGFAEDIICQIDASEELIPRIVELPSVQGPRESPLTKSEDESTEAIEQRDVSGASTRITDKLHTVEGAKGYVSTKLIDKTAEGKLERTDVLEAAIPRMVELHTVECAEDTPSKKTEDLAEVNARRRNILRALTPRKVELHTVEGAEGEDISEPLLLQSTGAALLPHPSKALTGGEDACFVALGNWLGVADGVSQWSPEGTSPGLYARELMENCERTLSDCKGAPLTKPEDVLVRAVAQTKCPGSSTVLVAYFDGQTLHVANIGNSGFIIIRNSAVFKRSSPMIHGFNFPLQILRGVDPLELIERYSIDLDEGDVIVTATDGLFDNLYEKEIASIVIKSLQRRMRLQDIAEFLATSALEVGQSNSRRSPFADAVEASGYLGYTGGKIDDVTVILSHVQKKSSC